MRLNQKLDERARERIEPTLTARFLAEYVSAYCKCERIWRRDAVEIGKTELVKRSDVAGREARDDLLQNGTGYLMQRPAKIGKAGFPPIRP
jgi:hypothetical protein